MKKRTYMRKYITIALLCVACLVAARGVWGMIGTFLRAHTEARSAEQELAKTNERATEAAAAVADITDPLLREAELRTRFDMGKPGEHLLTVVDDELVTPEKTEAITWFDRLRASLSRFTR